MTEKYHPSKSALQHPISNQRLPPQAVEIEEAVLGAIMLEQDCFNAISELLFPDLFYKPAHVIICQAIINLSKSGIAIDILTVTRQLMEMGMLNEVGGPGYISTLTNRVASSYNIEHHIRIIIQQYIRRRLIVVGSEIAQKSYDDTVDVFDLLDIAESSIFDVTQNTIKRGPENMLQLVNKSIDHLQRLSQRKTDLTGVASGFTELDRITGGWQNTDLIILAARPAMGKSAFVLNMARNASVDFQKPIAVFSLEMSSMQLVTRLIASECGIPGDRFKRAALTEAEWELINLRAYKIADAPIFIDDSPALTTFELRSKARRLVAEHDIKMIIVDYLQLMGGENDYGNRDQHIGSISRSLKGLAKELNVPVIALSQLSRAVETRGGDKRPQLSDLRESGNIEQDADMVIFLHRPEYYGITEDADGNTTRGQAEIIIAKHRNGAIGSVNLRFIQHLALFQSNEPSQADQSWSANSMPPNTDFLNQINNDDPF